MFGRRQHHNGFSSQTRHDILDLGRQAITMFIVARVTNTTSSTGPGEGFFYN